MKIKTSEASGPVLDWMVAKCEGFGPDQYMKNIDIRFDVNGKASCLLVPINRVYVQWSPSTDWAQGGPILQNHIGALEDFANEGWTACCMGHSVDGNTPLEAICRAYVTAKLGDEVEVPEELQNG